MPLFESHCAGLAGVVVAAGAPGLAQGSLGPVMVAGGVDAGFAAVVLDVLLLVVFFLVLFVEFVVEALGGVALGQLVAAVA
jgi:hypothetical protein